MENKSGFKKETVLKVLKDILPLATDENLSFSARECKENKNVLFLTVSLQDVNIERRYILVRILNGSDLKKIEENVLRILGKVFTVTDKHNEVYLGFEKNDFFCPPRNNLELFKVILKALAEFQVQYLASNKDIENTTSKYDITEIIKEVTSLDQLKTLNTTDLLTNLQKSMDKLLKNELVVKSVGNIFAANAFMTSSEKCTFLDLGNGTITSPVYDFLSLVFTLANKNFRQLHFKALLTFYYQNFVELLKKTNHKMAEKFTKNVFDGHVKVFLPIVKIEAAFNLTKNKSFVQNQQDVDDLLENIKYFLKYPKINYEDCIEAVSNKIGSLNFELIGYQLVPVDQKNGHLGEYFFLKSKVRHSGKIEDFSMFTKVLALENEQLTAIVQDSGLSDKEQFFFRTFSALLEKHGLDSLINFIPKVYFDRQNHLIIMEDLAKDGFKPYKTDVKLGYDDLRLAFLNSAKFHAATILLEDRMSKIQSKTVRLNEIYGEFLGDVVFTVRKGIPINPLMAVQSKPGMDKVVEKFADVYNKKLSYENFKQIVDALVEGLPQTIAAHKEFRNVINHGDFYASNMLVKYDENGVPLQNAFVDFQLIRYSPPTEDLLFLTYVSSNKEIRQTYLDTLLEEYYQALKKNLHEFGVDINKIYTPQQFKECVEFMKPTAIVAALLYGHINAAPTKEKEEIFFNSENYRYYFEEHRDQYVEYMFSKSESFTTFMKELIEELYDYYAK